MVRLIGKSRVLYCAVLSALLIAALFCGCTIEDTDNVTAKKTVLPEAQSGGNEDTVPGVSGPVYKEEDKTPGTWEGLSAQTEKQIIQDYWDFLIEKGYGKEFLEHGVTIDSIRISRYYGTYNGYSVVVFDWAVITVVWSKEIGGIYFYEPTPPNTRLAQKGMITAWKDGRFYDIADLYEEGLLTREDLIQIADRQTELRGWKPPAINVQPALNVQYIRTAYFYDAECPPITIVSSKEDLERYYEKHKRSI